MISSGLLSDYLARIRPYSTEEQIDPPVKNQYGPEDIEDCIRRKWRDAPQLPGAFMGVLDRIIVQDDAGPQGKGIIIGEFDIKEDLPFFPCHFPGDPVEPGALQVDSLWQLLGFFLGRKGAKGKGRAQGIVIPKDWREAWKDLKEPPQPVQFVGEILPSAKLVRSIVEVTSYRIGRVSMGIANGTVLCDDKVACIANGLKVMILPR